MLLAVIVVRVISLSSHIKSQSLACMNHVIDNAPINYESTEKKLDSYVVKSETQMLKQYSLSAAHYTLWIQKKKELTSAVR